MPPSQGSTVNNNENVFINIQLLYDPDAPTDPEIWNGGFCPISLHSSIKHIVSNAKNIKDSLQFMAKYIANKQIEPLKANNVMDLVGIGDAVWNFISFIYKSNWDALYTDNKSNTLRRKIAAKFTSKIQLAPKKPAKETTEFTLASIEKIPPPICYRMLWTLIFFFFFYLFSLILYFFSFEFLFLFLFSDDEEACDIAVT